MIGNLNMEIKEEEKILDGLHEKWWLLNDAAKKIYNNTNGDNNKAEIPKELKNYRHSNWSVEYHKHESRLKQLENIQSYITDGKLPNRPGKNRNIKYKEKGNNTIV